MVRYLDPDFAPRVTLIDNATFGTRYNPSLEADVDMKIDLYGPTETPAFNRPLIIWLHGGGWGSPTISPVYPDKRFARYWVDFDVAPYTYWAWRGYCVAAIDYRVGDIDGNVGAHTAADDLRVALNYLDGLKATHSLDMTKVIIAGGSVGSNACSAFLNSQGGYRTQGAYAGHRKAHAPGNQRRVRTRLNPGIEVIGWLCCWGWGNLRRVPSSLEYVWLIHNANDPVIVSSWAPKIAAQCTALGVASDVHVITPDPDQVTGLHYHELFPVFNPGAFPLNAPTPWDWAETMATEMAANLSLPTS